MGRMATASGSTHAPAPEGRGGRRHGHSVTVVVPVLDGERFLGEALESILSQTYAPSEVIVMDDGSTDSTPAIAASYGDAVRYVRQPAVRGIYGNANDGIELASGDLVGVFHADDVYLPELVEREVEWLERHPRAGAVFCSDVFVDGDGRELGRLALPPEVRGERPLAYGTVLEALLTYKNRFLRCPTALVRASAYRELGGYRDEEFKNTADLELWLRLVRRYPIGVLEDHLLLYRRGHGSSSERYHARRTEPERFFAIMDAELARGAHRPSARALREYEAHRAQDATLRAASLYVLEDLAAARAALSEVRVSTLLRGREIQRRRMAVLALALRGLARLPRVELVARAIDRRLSPSPSPSGGR